jgi:hypothetical protein
MKEYRAPVAVNWFISYEIKQVLNTNNIAVYKLLTTNNTVAYM